MPVEEGGSGQERGKKWVPSPKMEPEMAEALAELDLEYVPEEDV